ncbi:MAG: hypothetical protein H7Y00_14945 [Fimbriimonadaceae bacterium]|nr:hypothetical protein [Chitinophagales bacterium]
MSLVKILIVADEKTGMGVIMQSYLQFYSTGQYETHLLKNADEIHPLVIQVMKEDGIDITNFMSRKTSDIKKTIFQTCIVINESIPSDIPNINTEVIHLNFASPLASTGYDIILEKFRAIREEIKRSAIEITGKLSLVG